jgi:DNA-binding winged helix-turn-helix (wHTH) protein
MQAKQFYEFGPFRIDVALCRLLRDGALIALPPKAFDLLLLLVRNPNRVISKAELLETLWPGTFVEEGNLTQHVFTLRKALGTQPNGEQYIQTASRRGYCFEADVRESTDTAAPPEATKPSGSSVTVDGERKHATVLYCGVANAAALAERLGSARLHDLMTDLAGIANDEAARYEGILRQSQPDEFVAVFGARITHEDDARRAVLAALAIEHGLAGSSAKRRTTSGQSYASGSRRVLSS